MKSRTMKTVTKTVIAITMILMMAAGCRTSAGYTMSDRPIQNLEDYETLKEVEASIGQYRVLMVPLGSVDLGEAAKAAKNKAKADALIEMRWDETQYNFFIVNYSKWTVRGLAVRKKAEGAAQ